MKLLRRREREKLERRKKVSLRSLLENKSLRAKVLERVEEFLLNRHAGKEVWFKELVLCILTSNSSFVSAYSALMNLMDYLMSADQEKVSEILRKSGYRFYNLKARYIIEAKKFYNKLTLIKEIAENNIFEAREYLVENVYGLGMKESSHFLRNVGYFDLAIIDRHVLQFLREYNILSDNFRQVSRYRYLWIEGILRSISKKFGYEVGIFDLFIWYYTTHTILK